MRLEKHIDRALLKSELHWRENVWDFPSKDSPYSREQWAVDNCSGNSCALCKLKDKQNIDRCVDMVCPLNDEGSMYCCTQWAALAFADVIYKSHLKAVHRRIVRECKKRGLTLLEDK